VVPSDEDFEVPAVFSGEVVLLPHMTVVLSMGEKSSRAAIASALNSRRLVAMIPSDGYEVGDIGTLALLEDDRGGAEGSVELKGLWRIKLKEIMQEGAAPSVKFRRTGDSKDLPGLAADVVEKVHGQVDEFSKLMPSLPQEVVSFVKGIDSPGMLADVCAGAPIFTDKERLELLETLDPKKRLSKVSDRMERDLQALREVTKSSTIPECEICMDFADRAFEADSAAREEMMAAFLEHVISRHPAEVMRLIAEKYGPAFMQKRSLR
jgi:ATP-dependent Lon protease